MFTKYLLSVIFALISLIQLYSQCINTALIDPDAGCIQVFDPVCGCNGRTYSNDCIAGITDGVTSSTSGACTIFQASAICSDDSTQIGVIPNTTNTYAWSPATNLSCTDCAAPFAFPMETTTYELTITNTAGVSTYTYFDVVVSECSVCAINDGFSFEIKDIVKTIPEPATQIDLVIDFKQNFQSEDACTWSWDFGNGTTSTDSDPTGILFSTLNNNIPVTEAYDVCMSVYDCSNQLIETCCNSIGPFNACEDATLINALQDCGDAIDPVCGCNNVTYSNICEAVNTDGIHNWTEGPCNIESTYQICAGQSARIGLPAFEPNTEYTWLPTTSLSCEMDCFQANASPDQTTLYQLEMMNNLTGEKTYKYYQVEVTPAACAIFQSDVICLGDSIQIGVIPNTTNTYAWSPATNLTCTDCAAPFAFPTETTTYELTITDTDGVLTYADFEVVVNECSVVSVCETNDGFSFEIKDIVKTTPEPATQIDLVIDFEQNFLSDDACAWSWDFGNGTTSTDRDPSGILFSTLSDNLPVTEAYDVCMSVYDCGNQLIETCCNSIGPFNVCEDAALINAVQDCSNTVDPVCGCNNVTYSNICAAVNTDGVHNWTEGPCDIESVYQICTGQSVRIGLPSYVAQTQFTWFPSTSLSCSSCFQTDASPDQTTAYRLEMLNTLTGETTYKYYRVEVLSDAFCCTPNNLGWLNTIIDSGLCTDCYNEVKQIEISGINYIYFMKDSINCTDATSLLTYCNGNVFCEEDQDGFCLDALNYSVVENIWSKNAFCGSCGVADENELSWLFNDYGDGNYTVDRYAYNNNTVFYIEKCNTTNTDTLTRKLVNCNNDLLCAWNGQGLTIDNAGCSDFSAQSIFDKHLIECGCIDPSLIDPDHTCSRFPLAVCGCDGKYYVNSCLAEKVGGVTSTTRGACNNNPCVDDTIKVFDGFLASEEFKAEHLIQIGVPVIGNNTLILIAEQEIELRSGFECPENATLDIYNRICN